MSTEYEPYIPRNPGDLWTADDFNDVQRKIRKDIAEQVKKAMDEKKHVPNADNAAHLEDKTGDEWANDILEKARQDLPSRTGYACYFLPLRNGRMETIEHNLGRYAHVDLYRLRSFRVICSEDEEKYDSEVYFFLYHSGERTSRLTRGSETTRVTIEDPDEGIYGMPWHELLALYKVPYNDRTTLDDLENEFWKAFFVKPNVAFNDDEICHSIWFDTCCGARRTVGDLKQKGEFNEIKLKVVPVKDVNPYAGGPPEPLNVTVAQLNFNTISLTYGVPDASGTPPYIGAKHEGGSDLEAAIAPTPSGVPVERADSDAKTMRSAYVPTDIRVMVLLKV
ncbi:MAG: hypothetical protein ABW250_04765 [Pyrinomonadaceae bacterium]